MIELLNITVGLIMLLCGFGIIKNNWKDDTAKKKHEKRLKIGGAIIMLIGILRAVYRFINVA